MPESNEKNTLQKRLLQDEAKRKKMLMYVYYAIGGSLVVLIIMICCGYWLHSEEGGIYADCSNPANRRSPYCQPKVPKSEREWKDLGKGGAAPFTLHDD